MYKSPVFIIGMIVTLNLVSHNSCANTNNFVNITTTELSISDTLLNGTITDSMSVPLTKKNTPSLKQVHSTKNQKSKKWIMAISAFPFPLGFVGAHRIMLGTKPWVPVVYVATFGGCFGLLPLIDFCVILLSKDITQYENNPNIFMWIK